MEIQCPSCQKKLSIGDQFAGQLVKCPACASVFMAPSLAASPSPAPSSSSSPPPLMTAPAVAPTIAMPMALPVGSHEGPDAMPVTGEAPPRPASPYTPPLPSSTPPPVLLEEEPPGPPSDLGTTRTVPLDPDVLRWVAPVALALVFGLSFFSWLVRIVVLTPPTIAGLSLWQIAFGEHGSAMWMVYLLVTLFLAMPLAWAKLLMELNLVPTPDFLRPFWFWRSAVVAGVVAVAFTFAALAWLRLSAFTPTAFGMFLGLRAHLVALVALGLEFWLAHRKKKRLPLPEVTVRW
jgi:hypothetical protein